jgi:hypothetical protein
VRNVLNRKTYVGTVIVGDNRRSKYYSIAGGQLTKRGRGELRNVETLELENIHPAIIEQDTFDACRAMRNTTRNSHARKGHRERDMATR